jgi:hypothetical protein
MSVIASSFADPRHEFRYGMGDTVAAAETLARIRAFSRVAALRRAAKSKASERES